MQHSCGAPAWHSKGLAGAAELSLCPLSLQESIVIVEYPKRLAHLIRDTLGPLSKLRDRRYGRTFIAIYGPSDSSDDDE